MDPKDPKFRDAVTALARLQKLGLAKLNEYAREHGISIRATNEDGRQFLGRVYSKVTGRRDFDLAYSTLAFIESIKDDHAVTCESNMRDRIKKQVTHELDEIKTADEKTDRDFLDLLRQV